MSKKKRIVLLIIILFVIMLIPIKNKLFDGGSTQYKAVLYEVTKIHRINSKSFNGYEDGWRIKILGFQVYSKVDIEVRAGSAE